MRDPVKFEKTAVMHRKGDEKGDDRRGHRRDPCPPLAFPHAIPSERGHGNAGRHNEPGRRDMEMIDVRHNSGTERVQVSLRDTVERFNAQLEPFPHETADEEYQPVSDEGEGADEHP